MSTQPPVAAILSLAAQADKFALASGDAWLMLADINWQGQHIRVVRNVDDYTYDAGDGNGPQDYQKFNFDLSVERNSGTQLPSLQLKASNVLGLLQNEIEQYAGVVGATVALYFVNTAHVSGEDSIAIQALIVSTKCDAQSVTFTLGAPKPQQSLFPRYLYRADFCMWVYKGKQCAYSGPLPTCDRTFDGANGCKFHANDMRFGGFPGIATNGAAIASQT